MPFTPFHLGPGALLKAVGGDRFSFTIFAGSQILMDVEPLIRIVRGDAVLHGISHTLLGAFAIACASVAVGVSASNLALRYCGIEGRVGWMTAAASAFIGTYSHVALDALMHSDMRPFWPIVNDNPLLGLVSLTTLHVACIGTGLLGGVIIALRIARSV